MSITTEDFFQVPKSFFSNKEILDVGCGSIARNAISFYQMGSKNITAMDDLIPRQWTPNLVN